MKLVDILAQELKVWPEGVQYILQGITSGWLRNERFDEIEPRIMVSAVADDAGAAGGVTRAQWQAAIDALKADQCKHLWVDWSEIEACELCNATRKIGVSITIGNDYFISEGPVTWYESDRQFIGKQCIVKSLFENVHGTRMAAVEMLDGNCLALREDLLYRTPEQVAAEGREKAIEGMTEKALYGHYAFTKAQAKIACTVLFDAGYRKFEITNE